MKVIHKSNIEYTEFVTNPGIGCPGGCHYCWSMKMNIRFKKKKDYKDWLKPEIKENYIKYLTEDLEKIPPGSEIWYGNSIDAFAKPYLKTTELALELFSEYPIKVRLLSKYNIIANYIPTYVESDEAEFLVGLSITTMSEQIKNIYEPYTSSIKARMRAIERLSQNEVKYWVSMEPVLPKLNPIKMAEFFMRDSYCEQIVIGKLNYWNQEFFSDVEYLRWVLEAQRLNKQRPNFIHIKKEHLDYLKRRKILKIKEDKFQTLLLKFLNKNK